MFYTGAGEDQGFGTRIGISSIRKRSIQKRISSMIPQCIRCVPSDSFICGSRAIDHDVVTAAYAKLFATAEHRVCGCRVVRRICGTLRRKSTVEMIDVKTP